MDKFYHTQEKRNDRLVAPIACTRDDAWLGSGYYFWMNEDDAVFWGIKSKRQTGEYEIYRADIDTSDSVLDTVFNREHYFFWVKQLEKVAMIFKERTGIKPTLKEINDFFLEKGTWLDINGIMFQDISQNPDHYMVRGLQYKKRIQIVVYNRKIIRNFRHHFDGVCV